MPYTNKLKTYESILTIYDYIRKYEHCSDVLSKLNKMDEDMTDKLLNDVLVNPDHTIPLNEKKALIKREYGKLRDFFKPSSPILSIELFSYSFNKWKDHEQNLTISLNNKNKRITDAEVTESDIISFFTDKNGKYKKMIKDKEQEFTCIPFFPFKEPNEAVKLWKMINKISNSRKYKDSGYDAKEIRTEIEEMYKSLTE